MQTEHGAHELLHAIFFSRIAQYLTCVGIDHVGSTETTLVVFFPDVETIAPLLAMRYLYTHYLAIGRLLYACHEGIGRLTGGSGYRLNFIEMAGGRFRQLGIKHIHSTAETDRNHDQPTSQAQPEMYVVYQFPDLLPGRFF